MTRPTITSPSGAKVREIANPAAVAFRWTDQYPDFEPVEHELTWIRDTTGFYYGTRRHSVTGWTTVRVQHPDYQPGTLAEARTMAAAFIGGTP